MDNLQENFCVFVETNIDTRLMVLVHKDETVSHFKENLCKEHNQCFPESGEIKISALKVERGKNIYHISESMILSKVFEGVCRDWYMYADAVRVEKGELLSIMAANQNHLNNEKEKEIANDTNDLTTVEDGLETEVAVKMKSSDGNKSQKKSSVDLTESAVDSVSCADSPRVNLDADALMGTTGKETESAEKNDSSMPENPQSFEEDRPCQEKTITSNSELVDDLRGGIEQESEKEDKTVDVVKIDQEKALAATLELVDGHNTSSHAVNESEEVSGEVQVGVDAEHCVIIPRQKLDESLSRPIQKDNESGEGSKLAPTVADNVQTSELEASSGLATTEKKKKRKKDKSRSSRTSKKAKLTASQSQPDIFNNESLA